MPIYEYACEKCGKTSEVLQKVDQAAPETCPECGASGSLHRKMSRSSFVLKGGGWYKDLYASTKKDGGGEGDAPAPATPANSDSGAPQKAQVAEKSKESTSAAVAPAVSPAPSPGTGGTPKS